MRKLQQLLVTCRGGANTPSLETRDRHHFCHLASVTCLQVPEGDLCSGLISDQVTLQKPDPEAPDGEQHLEQDSEGEELDRNRKTTIRGRHWVRSRLWRTRLFRL